MSSWALPPPSKGQGACCPTEDMRSNSVAPTATRYGHSVKTAGGKLGPEETVGFLTLRAARLHFTSEQFWMGKTDENRPTTKKHNLSWGVWTPSPLHSPWAQGHPVSSDFPGKCESDAIFFIYHALTVCSVLSRAQRMTWFEPQRAYLSSQDRKCSCWPKQGISQRDLVLYFRRTQQHFLYGGLKAIDFVEAQTGIQMSKMLAKSMKDVPLGRRMNSKQRQNV